MCLILDKPAGVMLSEEDLRSAVHTNADGFGIMYIDPKTGVLKVDHTLWEKGKEEREFVAVMEQYKNIHVCIHLRYTTHGATTKDNCHPFQVLNKEEHGRDLWVMHNGTISSSKYVDPKDGRSDTALYVEQVLRPLLAYNPEMLHNPTFQRLIDTDIGWSKLLFMDDTGRITRIGDFLEYEGCVASNKYSFDYYHRTPKTYSNYSHSSYSYSGYRNGSLIGYLGNNTRNTVEDDKEGEETTVKKSLNTAPLLEKTKEVVEKDSEAIVEVVEEITKSFAEPCRTSISSGYGKEPDDDDVIQVLNHTVKINDLSIWDCLSVDPNDIYDLVCDYPDKMAEVLSDALYYLDISSDVDTSQYYGTIYN